MKLGSAIWWLAASGLVARIVEAQDRQEIHVNFEYQLEVDDVDRQGSTEDVLATIDSEILYDLQDALPNGKTKEGEDLPNVQFASINSGIFSECFTDSEQCSLVKSDITVSYEGEKPTDSVEAVTLRLLQDYMVSYTEDNPKVTLTYMYPSMVSTLTQFRMSIVYGSMDDTEITVVESTFEEVFGAIVYALEGDTEVNKAKFVYQDLFPTSEGSSNSTLSTDLLVTGFCRDCSSEQFGEVVDDVIVKNIPAFQNKLKKNANNAGSDYFDSVESISFSVPQLPSKLPPIQDESIFDGQPPKEEPKQPWFLWFGITMALVILLCGCYWMFRDPSEYGKEEQEYSTNSGEEEASGVEQSYEEEETYGDYPIEEQTTEGGTKDSEYDVVYYQ